MIASDSFYRYALNDEERLVSVSDVNESNRYNGYKCVSCGCELTPALGKKNAHHFRHKTDTCSYESYIHKLWKQYVYEQWHKQPHFYVSYIVERFCDKVSECKLRGNDTKKCENGFFFETVDLKEKYDTCEIEGVYGNYRADLLLTNSNNQDIVPTFLEICYKHPCDEDKQKSGIPIVELKVDDDNLHWPQTFLDCRVKRTGNVGNLQTTMDISIFGYELKKQIEHNVRRFCVYQDVNGIIHGRVDDTVLSCHNLNEHASDSMMEIFVIENDVPKEVSLFDSGIKAAARHGVKIQNCAICRHKGTRGNQCLITMNNDTDSWVVNINDFSNKELDKTNYTYFCRNYFEWLSFSDSLSRIPIIVWVNKTYNIKPINKSEITISFDQKRMKEIAIRHQTIQK